jgi:ferredoxin
MNKITLYYFSGTGNSRSVAKWLADEVMKNDKEVEIKNVADVKHTKIVAEDQEILGFISPTHGFNYPPIMISFLLGLPRARNNTAFVMNTRAGLKLGKVFIPGLSGIALLLAALILLLKGYKVVGMRPVDLPSNWISIHPGLNKPTVGKLFEKRKKEVIKFAQRIVSGKKDYRAFWDIIQDLLIAPISVLYYFVGRFVFAKSFYASRKCNNCKACIEQCPVGAIKMIDNRPFWKHSCESCMQCMNNCPHKAIETAHGYLIGMMYLINSVVLFYLYLLLDINLYISSLPEFLQKFSGDVLNAVIFLTLLFLSYRIFHYLLKFSFFEKIVLYTSLTKLPFWNRYRAPKKFSK